MPELVFHRGTEVLFRAGLDGRSFRVGASPLNDLQLPDGEVAPFQASVEHTPEGYALVDRSGRGTTLNGTPVQSGVLRDGDRVRMGALEAVFVAAASPGSTRPLWSGSAGPVVEDAALVLRTPDGKRHAVAEGGLRLGKDTANDVVVNDDFVSAFHALVFRRDGGTLVRDLGSTNGTFVNGLQVTEAEVPVGATLTPGRVPLTAEAAERAAGRKAQSVGDLLYADPAMAEVAARVRSVAPHDDPVCILGESGAGKELVARAIHQLGPRSAFPFVAVNCAALSPQLVESELFGHERGAFTGADRARAGAFEEAGKGTLFLDEVGDLAADAQAKLLRALENREIRRVGGEGARKVACRVVAATHQNLLHKASAGGFRNDLFHRLAALPIRLPALRERRDDIPVLVNHFLSSMGEGNTRITPAAMEKLQRHAWPGNVRELKNVLLQAVVFGGRSEIRPQDLSFAPMQLQAQIEAARIYTPGRTLEDIELDAMEQAVATHGSQAAAARELGIARSTLIARLGQRKKTR